MDDKPHDEPTPIPLKITEDWKGLHGGARVGDCTYWMRGRRILVRRNGNASAWRDLNAGDLHRLYRAGCISSDIHDRMQIRILT